jgi:hypothetical protein
MTTAAIIAMDIKMVARYGAMTQDVDYNRAGAFLLALFDHFLNGIAERAAGSRQILRFLVLARICRIVKLLEDCEQICRIALRV